MVVIAMDILAKLVNTLECVLEDFVTFSYVRLVVAVYTYLSPYF